MVDEISEENKEEDNEIDVVSLYNEIHNPQVQERVVPEFKDWAKVEMIRADDEIIQRELNTEKLKSAEIREKFLEFNKKWIQSNLRSLFTDENFEDYRGLIISKLSKMFGYLNRRIESDSSEEIFPEDLKNCVKKSTIDMALMWISKARRNRKLFMQAFRVIQKNLKDKCLYCGSSFTLQCEIVENIEDLFMNFRKSLKFVKRHLMWNGEE